MMITAHLQALVPVQVAPAVVRQESPLQQVLVGEQVCPALAHAAGWHVPLVWPEGMLQAKPVQQSALAVQTAPCG